MPLTLPSPRRVDPLHVALAFWLALLLAVTVRTALRPTSHTVFPVFASGAQHWWAGESLYEKDEGVDYFRYPPAFALAVSPFAAMGLRAGGIAWGWFVAGAYLAGLWAFARDVLPGKLDRGRLALFLVFAALGSLRGLWNGQSNALVVGLLLLGAAALARERWWTASLFLAASFWLKLVPVAPILLLAALWPARLLPRLAATLLLGGLVPFLTSPPHTVLEQYRDWAAHLLGSSGERWPGFRDGWTVWQAVRESADGVTRPFPFKEPLDSLPYRAIQLAGALAALIGCLAAQARGGSGPWLVNVALGAGCCWLMLLGPSVEHASFAFLAPSLAWAVADGAAWPRGRWLILAAFSLVTFLGWGGLVRPVVDQLPLVLLPLPLGTGLFGLWLVGHARHEARSRRGPTVPTPPARLAA